MIINKLYCSDGIFFDEIEFKAGFNVILGESSDISQKRNGVGKSISIEFINFALLKDFDKSRLKSLPQDIINVSSPIFLDIDINGKPITIKRDLKNPCYVTIYDGLIVKRFDLIDAKKYLLSKFEFKNDNLYSSFRDLLNPLTRDERCEFKSIPDYSDTNIKVPVDYKVHLFYLGIDNDHLHSAMMIKDDINSDTSIRTKTKNQVENLLGKSIKEARVELNKLSEERDELNNLVSNNDYRIFDILDEDYQNINSELKSIRIKMSSLRLKINQAKDMVRKQDVDVDTIKIVYEKVRAGLGESISRNLQEVINFKNTIDSYTNNIVKTKVENIKNELSCLNERRIYLISEREKFNIEKSDIEYDMKEAIGKLAIKNEIILELKGYLKKIDQLDMSIKKKKINLDQERLNIELQIDGCSKIISSFESLVLDAHKNLFDDYSASFAISVNNRKEIISFDLRIKEDGGHSNERAKVFIYDFSLLTHRECFSNHLGFLIHDNIFDNDDDTFQKALNYIDKKLFDVEDKQYILTLNSDKLTGIDLDFDLNEYVRASFTKEDKFLKRDYEEVR
ncbi:DUF2326 domain-containing protein [Photobacterium damselae]|uniref:DUF2326 domain-containing protein n=1 Tax=Photobacterium damselae TaxID=38293 RepID=UPI003D7D1176